MTTLLPWARLSDGLVMSAVVVLCLALLAHAAENALRVRSRVSARAGVVAPAGLGTTATLTTSAETDARGPRVELIARVGVALTVVGVGFAALGLASRGLAAGRAPWATMYEFAVAGTVSVGVAYLVILRRRALPGLGLWVTALLVLTLGLATTVLYSPADDLVPVLNSYWLVVHVAAAIIAGGMFSVGFLATAVALVRTRSGRSPADALATTLRDVAHTVHLVAFPIWTVAVIAGAIWAENAWGRYWGWDPKETWAFITWVFYAGYLHAQSTSGWRGTKSSWLAVAGYAAFLFNFFGVNIWLPGLHSYAGV